MAQYSYGVVLVQLPFAKPLRKERYCGDVMAAMGVLVQEFVYDLNCKGCPSTFVATKTSPQYLSFREDFANGGVLEYSSTVHIRHHTSRTLLNQSGAYGKWARGKEESEKGKGTKFVFRFINPSLSLECIPNLNKEC